MKLSALTAIEQSVKEKGNRLKSDLYKLAQKETLFEGFSKKYRPKEEKGEKLPDEKHKVAHTVRLVVEDVGICLRDLFDVEASKDYANCSARADIVVDGVPLVKGAPATFLLYLRKELTDLGTFIDSLPTTSDDEEWKQDAAAGLWKTEPTQSIRTKKVQKGIVLYDATDKHPAQTQLITEDEVVGYWDMIKMSGATTASDKKKLLARVRKLLEAVKVAIEDANQTEAPQQKAGTVLIDWLLAE